jgi:hypothetical protein
MAGMVFTVVRHGQLGAALGVLAIAAAASVDQFRRRKPGAVPCGFRRRGPR